MKWNLGLKSSKKIQNWQCPLARLVKAHENLAIAMNRIGGKNALVKEKILLAS
jgi:hypothetical protein